MPETGCPSFLEIVFYIFSIIFSLAIIGYIWLGPDAGTGGEVPLYAIIIGAAFLILALYSAAKLILLLFPARRKTCPACRLLAKVIEID
ncbi:MAG: hypothetical protein ACYDDV_07525 [Methanoregula sp.]